MASSEDLKRQRSMSASGSDIDSEAQNALKVPRIKSPLPDDSTEAMPCTPEVNNSVDRKLDQVISTLQALTLGVNQNTEAIGKLLEKSTSVEQELAVIKQENSFLKDTVATLEARQAHTDILLAKLESQVLDSQSRQMRMNLVFSGVPEKTEEKCLNTVIDVMKKKMKISGGRIRLPGGSTGDVSVDIAHRIGVKRSDPETHPRAIVLKLVDRHSKDVIMSHAKNLKGSSVSVSEQYPAKIRAKRASLVPDLKRERGTGSTAHIAYDKLVVDHTPVPSKDSRNADIACSHPTTYSPNTKPILSDPITKVIRGNRFTAYAAKVTTPEEVAEAKKHLWLVPGAHSAAHMMWAYKLAEHDDGDITSGTSVGYDCDGEFGSQGPMVGALANSCNVFIAILRWPGQMLGPKRFEVIRELAEEVVILAGDVMDAPLVAAAPSEESW